MVQGSDSKDSSSSVQIIEAVRNTALVFVTVQGDALTHKMVKDVRYSNQIWIWMPRLEAKHKILAPEWCGSGRYESSLGVNTVC